MNPRSLVYEEVHESKYFWYEEGNQEAGYDYAYFLHNGYGVKRNLKEAEKIFQELYKQGYEDRESVCFYLGYYAVAGVDGKKDYKKAFQYYSEGAEDPDAKGYCLNQMGMLYYYGQGVKKDEKKAFECYRKSAALGDDLSIVNVAWCYEKGCGVTADFDLALKLYREALEKGDEASAAAQQELDRLKKEGRIV